MRATAEVSRGAWVRTADTTYGHDRFPFGKCEQKGCEEAACHRVPHGKNQRLVCMDHKPSSLLFVPFLGQQEKIFAATERWVLAGGGAGGSKTFAGARLWLKQWTSEHARYLAAKAKGIDFVSKGHALFLRRTIPDLKKTAVVEDFKRYYKKIDPGAHWVQADMSCTFSCGYRVQFGGMEDEDGWMAYYGGEYTLIVFDEAVTFTKKQILELDSRLRCADPILDKQVQLYLLTNPVGGETKAWLRRRFVKCAPPETPVRKTVRLADRRVIVEWQIYIPSNLYDNPALVSSGRYEASLMMKGAAMRRALLLNDWDVDEGCWVGDDWDPAMHIVNPHPIPASYPKGKSMDWGFSSRAACHYWAIDPDGGMIIYRSVSWRKKTSEFVAKDIKRIESKPLKWRNPETGQTITIVEKEWDDSADCSNVYGALDAACWAKQGHELSLGEIFENAGCNFSRSEKGTAVKHAAADRIRIRLQRRYPDHTGKNDLAGIRFFRGTTETWMVDDEGNKVLTGPIHTLPVLPFDPDDPDLPDTDADDHDWDALAYGETSRPMPEDDERQEAEIIDFMEMREKQRAVAAGDQTHIGW